MTRVELTEQGRGPKNRKRTCTSEVCLCNLWLGGAGAESCRAGPPDPYTGTDWVSNCSPAEVRNQKSHTTCPRGVRSWQADVVRQSSRCRLDSVCFPLSLTSANGDLHLSWLSAAWSVESQSVLPRMVSHGDKGRRPQNRALPFSAQVSLIYARGICSAGDGYASSWYFGKDCCYLTSAALSEPHRPSNLCLGSSCCVGTQQLGSCGIFCLLSFIISRGSVYRSNGGMLVTTRPEQRQGSRSHLCLHVIFSFTRFVFFVSLSTLPFTVRPCVRLLMIRRPVIIFSMETSRSRCACERLLRIRSSMIILSMETLRSTRSYDEDFVSALRGSGASVLVGFLATLKYRLYGAFEKHGPHRQRHEHGLLGGRQGRPRTDCGGPTFGVRHQLDKVHWLAWDGGPQSGA